jgi:SAM-dependent methyltransferase
MPDDLGPGFRDLDRSRYFDEMLAGMEAFDADPQVRAMRRATYRLMRPHPGARLLDAGCGPGTDVAALAPKVLPGGCVIGIDISQRMVDLARKRHAGKEGAEFRLGSVEKIPFPDAYFDAARSMRTLQYLEDRLPALRELARVTRPGGRVVVGEGGIGAVDLPDSAVTRDAFMRPGPSKSMRLPALMREAGLVRVQVKPITGVVLGRPHPLTVEYATGAAANAVESGLATPGEAEAWLADVKRRIAAREWFSVDVYLAVAGTVPEKRT